ncbi:5-carboxymethyl-2-hydroxymuconate Delta-isomerase [Actinacidiphila sp. bgisy144]|uniref:5-carboxymethyl-2-hydroxymuconate Delta-isomerase n=1 Tax=unclassified Actinacidiphila TaxID=2995708 RepID=UPI003EB89162
MPHSIVEYSANLADTFDRPQFAKGLHEALVRVAGGRAEGCKTRFVRLDETYIADGSPHYSMVHAQVGILSGRPPQVRRELAEAVLAALRDTVRPLPEAELQLSVDVRELDRETYAQHDTPAQVRS